MSQQNPSKEQLGAGKRFYGKYRGVVVSNQDPLHLGRIMASVPKIYGEFPSCWALPCLPGTGPVSGLYAVPEIESWVWIEFEEGDPQRPIWSGAFWEVPLIDPVSNTSVMAKQIVLQTATLNALTLDDVAGITLQLLSEQKVQLTPAGVVIQAVPGVSISVTADGITLQAAGASVSISAKGISLTAPAGITMTGAKINLNNALEVI